MKYARTDVVFGGNVPLTLARYTCRIKEATKGKSKAGNDKVVLRCEIIAPEKVNVGGQEFMIAGREFQVHQLLDPQVSYGAGRMLTFLEKTKFPMEKFGDDATFDDARCGVLAGFCFDAILQTIERVAERDPTPEERSAGVKSKVPILDAEGKQIVFSNDIDVNLEVCLPASQQTANPVW